MRLQQQQQPLGHTIVSSEGFPKSSPINFFRYNGKQLQGERDGGDVGWGVGGGRKIHIPAMYIIEVVPFKLLLASKRYRLCQ